jgi:hypothetical protein
MDQVRAWGYVLVSTFVRNDDRSFASNKQTPTVHVELLNKLSVITMIVPAKCCLLFVLQ